MSYMSLDIYVGLAGFVGFSKLLGCEGFIKKLSYCGEECELNWYSSFRECSAYISSDLALGLNIICIKPISIIARESASIFFISKEETTTWHEIVSITKAINCIPRRLDDFFMFFSSNLENFSFCFSVYRKDITQLPMAMLKKHAAKIGNIAEIMCGLETIDIYKAIVIGIGRKTPKCTFALNLKYCLISLTGFLGMHKTPYFIKMIIEGFSQLKQGKITDNIFTACSLHQESQFYV